MADQRTGDRGEDMVVDWLEENGWEILQRNYTAKLGEIDVVACRLQDFGVELVPLVIFAEVKTRRRTRGPVPEVRVDHHKRRKLVRLAQLFLAQHRLQRVIARFDVFGVDLDTGAIRHYPGAFDSSAATR